MTGRPLAVAIIGLGSRGLSVLERIVTLAKRAGPGTPVRVTLVDPRADGVGVHTLDQPDYLLLNTTCAQATMFPDPATVGEAVDAPGPTLYEWVTARGLKLAEDGFTVGTTGRPIRPTDFLPRRLLGEYLNWFLREVHRRVPGHVTVRTHRAEALTLTDRPDGRLQVALSGGATVAVDYAFLTTGYTANRPLPAAPPGRLITVPYPLPRQVAGVRPGESVAVGGFGLSAMDVMSCLTVGRGGRFRHRDGGCRYLPSGHEPVLQFFSRSGLPCRARPQIMHVDTDYRPIAFTPVAIDARRAAGGRLDFDRDVLPLVLTEMRVAFRRCEAALAGGSAAQELERELTAAAGRPDRVAEVLQRCDARLGRFDALAAFTGATGMRCHDAAAYQKWLAEVIDSDLAEGRRGFSGSPLKAALDVLRALRDTFRHAVDFGGLTVESLQEFHRRTVPLLNRAVVGPQYERHAELLALFEAGVARAPFGPAPQVSPEDAGGWCIRSTGLEVPHTERVDWLCAAHVPLPSVTASTNPLLQAMHRAGRIRPHCPGSEAVPGIDVDGDQRPIRADGTPEPRIRVLGPLCEGATFYNNLVPSPGFSRPILDAHRCVAALLERG